MSEKKTHWRKLHNPDHFGAYVFEEGQDLTVKIISVEKKLVNNSEGKKEEHSVAELEGQKPWILNVTNQKKITKILGTPYVEEWAGKSITLYVTKIRAFGESVEAVRVRTQLPTAPQLPELKPGVEKWESAIKALSKKSTTIEALKGHYSISPENQKKLEDAATAV